MRNVTELSICRNGIQENFPCHRPLPTSTFHCQRSSSMDLQLSNFVSVRNHKMIEAQGTQCSSQLREHVRLNDTSLGFQSADTQCVLRTNKIIVNPK